MNELSDRQIDIIRTTIQLIADEGIHNFSIRKLAKRVGVTEPAIYRHFESKDDLMIKLATYIARNWRVLFSELAIEPLPFIEKARIMFSEVMSYLDENREFAKTLLSTNLFASDSGMTGILLRLKNDGMVRFSEFLTDGQKAGQIRSDVDTDTVTYIFFGAVWWVVSDWIEHNFVTNLIERWQTMWSTLVQLLVTEEEIS